LGTFLRLTYPSHDDPFLILRWTSLSLFVAKERVTIVGFATTKDLIRVDNNTDLARVEGLNLENWVEL